MESKSETVEETDTQVYVADAKNISENAGIVRNSSISERPEIIIKNQEYYNKNHSEIHFKK